jgi:hypothetical protein
MMRAFALFAILLGACATSHSNGGENDGAVADSSGTGNGTDASEVPIDSPPGTIDAVVIDAAAIDAKPIDARPIDAKPGTIDAKVIDAKPIDAKPPVDAPVDGNGCTTQPCTLAPQCGCPANQSCDIDPTDLVGNVCRAINVPGKDTNTCGSFSECDKGYVCIGDGTHDTCKRYCTQNGDCGTPRGQCVIQLTDGSTPPKDIPGAVVCSSNCDPATSAAAYCPASYKSAIFTATFGGTDHDISDCEIQGTGTQGTNCLVAGAGDDTKCNANYACTTLNGTTFACRRYCNRTTGGTECAALGKTCIGFNPALTIGGTEYGVCN